MLESQGGLDKTALDSAIRGLKFANQHTASNVEFKRFGQFGQFGQIKQLFQRSEPIKQLFQPMSYYQ